LKNKLVNRWGCWIAYVYRMLSRFYEGQFYEGSSVNVPKIQ
jgi:hypothetical protein